MTSSATRRPAAGTVTALAAEAIGEAQRVGDAIALDIRELQASKPLDRQRHPGCAEPIGEALGVAHEAGAARILADADDHALARRPGSCDGVGLHVMEKLVVDALGGAAQGEFTQSRQVAGREKVLQCAFSVAGQVDFALSEPLQKVVGRDVDDLDVVGEVQDGVRNRFLAPGRG